MERATKESFKDLLERELNRRGGGNGRGNNDDDDGKPDRPEGPSILAPIILGALAGLLLAVLAKSKTKTTNS